REPVDGVLDDRPDREREQPRRAPGDAAAAGLVTRERRAVDEEDARAGAREPICGRRAGGAGADDGNVVAGHDAKLQWPAPGGVPERPKGTGCKPVGSAYGGSNPPAPTDMHGGRTTGKEKYGWISARLTTLISATIAWRRAFCWAGSPSVTTSRTWLVRAARSSSLSGSGWSSGSASSAWRASR